jgi:hypothetical protein
LLDQSDISFDIIGDNGGLLDVEVLTQQGFMLVAVKVFKDH